MHAKHMFSHLHVFVCCILSFYNKTNKHSDKKPLCDMHTLSFWAVIDGVIAVSENDTWRQ